MDWNCLPSPTLSVTVVGVVPELLQVAMGYTVCRPNTNLWAEPGKFIINTPGVENKSIRTLALLKVILISDKPVVDQSVLSCACLSISGVFGSGGISQWFVLCTLPLYRV